MGEPPRVRSGSYCATAGASRSFRHSIRRCRYSAPIRVPLHAWKSLAINPVNVDMSIFGHDPVATGAFGGVKQLLARSYDATLHDHLDAEAAAIAIAMAGADAQEGVAAFLERRKPAFRGA